MELRLETQASSPVPSWISGCLRSFHRESGFVSCGGMQVHSPLELENQCQASCQVDIRICGLLLRWTGLSHLPGCFELILGVTVESVQRSQLYLECIRTSGSFERVAVPLEFLSSVKLRPPPLEVQWERWDSFSNEAEK